MIVVGVWPLLAHAISRNQQTVILFFAYIL